MDVNAFFDEIRKQVDELKLQAQKQIIEPVMQKPPGYDPLTQALKLGIPATQLPELLQQYIFNPQTKRVLPQSMLYPENQPDMTSSRVTPESLTKATPLMFMTSGPTAINKTVPNILNRTTALVEEANIQKALPAPLSFLEKPKTPVTIEGVEPIMNTKRAVPITDIHGQKAVIPAGEPLTPYRISGNKILIKDSDEYILNKNQFQNLKGNAVTSEAQPFAPELAQTTETIKGTSKNEPSSYEELPVLLQGDVDEYQSGKIDEATLKQRLFLDGYDVLFDPTEGGVISNIYKVNTTPTKYSQYTLPGGENYREILIQAPDNTAKMLTEKGWYVTDAPDPRDGVMLMDDNNRSMGLFPSREAAIKSMSRISNQFESAHWNEPNVLAHIRMNERTYDGKKVAFMEEMQSDWARKGRSKGFATEITKDTAKQQGFTVYKAKSSTGEGAYFIDNPTNQFFYREGFPNTGFDTEVEAWNNITKKLKETSSAIPNHPLLKDWQKVSAKRALKDAVDSDAEYFAWTTGEQQAARYNLSKQVDDISWHQVAGTPTKSVFIKPKGDISDIQLEVDQAGKIVTAKGQPQVDTWVGKQLDQVIGKGVGEKILAGGSKGKLSGEGLNIGGEWAYNLYDRQVKNIVEDITGGKVEKLDLGLASENPRNTNNYMAIGKGDINYDTVKIGMEIAKDVNEYGDDATTKIVTKKLGNGKIRVVASGLLEASNDDEIYNAIIKKGYFKGLSEEGTINALHKDKVLMAKLDEKYGQTIDLSKPPSVMQQAIHLTPDIKAKIMGQAPQLKQPSGNPPSFQISDLAYQQTVKNGGVTISLSGNQPTKGFSYSPYKGLETIIPKDKFNPKDIDAFYKKNYKLLQIPGNHIGGWEDGGNIYLDVSQVGDPNAETLGRAIKSKQLGAFDLESLAGGWNGNIELGKMVKGVYNPIDEAINVFNQYRRKISSPREAGSSSGIAKIPKSQTPRTEAELHQALEEALK